MSHVRCIVLAGSVCVDCRVKHDGEKGCDLRSAHYALPVLLRATFVVADDVIAHEPPGLRGVAEVRGYRTVVEVSMV